MPGKKGASCTDGAAFPEKGTNHPPQRHEQRAR